LHAPFGWAATGGACEHAPYIALMGQDKKVRQGRLTFVLARGIGKAFVERDVDLDVVRAVLGMGGRRSRRDEGICASVLGQ